MQSATVLLDCVAYDVHGLLMTATPVDTHIHGDTHTDRQTDRQTVDSAHAQYTSGLRLPL